MRLSTKKPQVLIEDNSKALNDFLIAQDHPFKWKQEDLNKCVRCRVLDSDGRTQGYVWMHWIEGAPGIIQFHVCISPEYQGRWFNRRVINKLFSIAEVLGARFAMCDLQYPSIVRIAKRLKWCVIEDAVAFVPIFNEFNK